MNILIIGALSVMIVALTFRLLCVSKSITKQALYVVRC